MDSCSWRQGYFEEKTEVGEGGGEFAEPSECIIRGGQEERSACATVAKIFQVISRSNVSS
jgi:hypothetical protein